MPRWVLAIVIILALIAVDRAYTGGQNVAFVMLGLHKVADVFIGAVGALIRHIRA